MLRILQQYLNKEKIKMQFITQNFVGSHFWKNMDCVDLHPPSNVRGMLVLDKNAFRKTIKVPKLTIPANNLHKILPIVKKYVLKMENLKPVRASLLTNKILCSSDDQQKLKIENVETEINSGDHNVDSAKKDILLHPLGVKGWDSLPIDELQKAGITETNLTWGIIELSYENWRADEILKFILPKDQEGLSSFSKIGHIIHINLRDHLEPYKKLIGVILKEKIPNCRTVINKLQTIENTYRNFELELLSGDPDYQVDVKENGIAYEFDFSKVYWNPRLSTEHEKVVNLLKSSEDILYDVFAGVGPFSIPAAVKKKCHVLANDLNPESFKWLNHNIKKNKCLSLVKTFNKDGRDFIQEDIKKDLIERFTNDPKDYTIHIAMNLPGMAVEFLNAFEGLLNSKEQFELPNFKKTIVHVYSFAKGAEGTKEIVKELVENNIGTKLTENNLDGIYFVRNVAPNKDMYRVSFYLTREILFLKNFEKKKRILSEDKNEASKKRRP